MTLARFRTDRTRLLAMAVVALCASVLLDSFDGPPFAFLAGLCLGVSAAVAAGSLLLPPEVGPAGGG